MSIHLMMGFPSFLFIHHSVISSQIERRVATFGSILMTFIVKWPITVLVHCSAASNSTYVISKHHILPTRISRILNPVSITSSHLLDNFIPPALSYVCRFWDNHLEHTDFETGLFGK